MAAGSARIILFLGFRVAATHPFRVTCIMYLCFFLFGDVVMR